MFSGLVQQVGVVTKYKAGRLNVVYRGTDRSGDSVAVDGVCLTVTTQKRTARGRETTFDLSPETLSRTTLGTLSEGSQVNIERALRLQDALGGHIVQGHVDTTGRVQRIVKSGHDRVFWFEAPKNFMAYLVSKGSVAVNGVSLTVASIKGRLFSAAIIPYTLTHTTLGNARIGDQVNLEADIMAKYVLKYTRNR